MTFPKLRPLLPTDRVAVVELFREAALHDPTYLPGVSDGGISIEEWLDAKILNGGIVAVRKKEILAHVGIKRKKALHRPDVLWELCHLAVRPEERKQGLATALITTVTGVVPTPLWCTCVAGEKSFLLFSKLGWEVSGRVDLFADPNPGVEMVSS